MDFDFDLFVIGGGSGGVRAARIAASEGRARVALAEESRMGGTCVIRGCVPKKLMVYASEYPGLMQDARAYGWQVTAGAFDWGHFRTRLEAELTRLEGAYRGGLNGAGVCRNICATVAGSSCGTPSGFRCTSGTKPCGVSAQDPCVPMTCSRAPMLSAANSGCCTLGPA